MAVMFMPAWLWAAAQRRPAAHQAAPTQPPAPIIVMPPAPQPVTNNYTYNDNRYIVADQPAAQVAPLFGPNRPQLPAQRERVFKIVGEREEWQPPADGYEW
jgi:hypothetical protein